MKFEFWVVTLPVMGTKALKGESPNDRLNRELGELVGRGWEPVQITGPTIGVYAFLLRKELTS